MKLFLLLLLSLLFDERKNFINKPHKLQNVYNKTTQARKVKVSQDFSITISISLFPEAPRGPARYPPTGGKSNVIYFLVLKVQKDFFQSVRNSSGINKW